jgi:hypothetical protein
MKKIYKKENINALIEKNLGLNSARRANKLEYVMDFGDLSVQFHFCLN